MALVTEKNIIIQNPETKDFLADAYYPENAENLPVLIFAHGYKGYKDWGSWDLMAEKIAAAGFLFVKFNFSHNGTTLDNPKEFSDLEAFGQNNFSKEISDYQTVIEYFSKHTKANPENISIMGHSRGAGITVIEAFENEAVIAVISLAGVSHFGYRMPHGERLERWKDEGVMYTENARTKQQMPHYYQFYEDYKSNEDRFNIQYAAQHLEKPFLIIQGTGDETVKNNESELLHEWAKDSVLFSIEDASHTFGAKEPWDSAEMPEDLATAVEQIIKFLTEITSL